MFRTIHPIFKKGDVVIHPTKGIGEYSHCYAKDASVVKFAVADRNGIQTRVVVHKDIKLYDGE